MPRPAQDSDIFVYFGSRAMRTLKVLVIEDEILVMNTLAATLCSRGHQVTRAKNGRDGIEQLTEAKFDLVITDLIMPQMGGIEAILEIRKLSPKQRILAISGASLRRDVDLLEIARSFGALVLRKPFSADELLDAVVRTAA
jgi:CheY-like chemotaxis protein